METNERAKRERYQAAEKELAKLIEEVEGIEKGESKELEEKIYQGIFKIGSRLMEAVLTTGQEAVPTKIEGKCGHAQKLVGYRPKKMLTLFGELEWKRPYYQCQREQSEEAGEKGQAEPCSHGSCPEDELWGVEGKRTSPGVQRQVSYLCAMLTFEDAAATFRRMLPLGMSARQALNLMKPVGKALEAKEDEAVKALFDKALQSKTDDDEKPAQTSVKDIDPTFRSLGREKIQLPVDRTKQTKNPLMKSLQPQHLSLPGGTTTDVQQINALKTLENPAHRGTIGGLVHLVRNGLFRCRKLSTQQTLGQAIHQ